MRMFQRQIGLFEDSGSSDDFAGFSFFVMRLQWMNNVKKILSCFSCQKWECDLYTHGDLYSNEYGSIPSLKECILANSETIIFLLVSTVAPTLWECWFPLHAQAIQPASVRIPLSNVVECEHLFMQNSIFPMQLGCATSLLVCFFFVLSAIFCLIFKYNAVHCSCSKSI